MNYQQISNEAGDWLLDTVQRKPEALLLIAAGCALLMRSGRPMAGLWSARGNLYPRQNRSAVVEQDSIPERETGYASKVAETVSEYGDTARQAVSSYAEGAKRGISDSSDWLRATAETTYNTASDALRDQPILIAGLGLAAGAALAAFSRRPTLSAVPARLSLQKLQKSEIRSLRRPREQASERGTP